MRLNSLEFLRDLDATGQGIVHEHLNGMEEHLVNVIHKAVAKQHSLQQAIVRLQDFDTSAENVWKVLSEVDIAVSSMETASSDGELQELIEQCQVGFCREFLRY